ncbi:MAG: glycosyltransferase family A protein [Bacteroidota bacterium]|nr:glycosyltransferase family A protein [Bacteroidota bacterium]
MSFANFYFKRFQTSIKNLPKAVPEDTNIITVIPASDEPNLLQCLESVTSCHPPRNRAEIIVVINHSENAPKTVKSQNEQSYHEVQSFAQANTSPFNIRTLYLNNQPKKHAGVGLARKSGMDLAVAIYNQINKPQGIITCTDADCTVDKNYFRAIEHFFLKNNKPRGVSIRYEHEIEGENYSSVDYDRIISYELHLRYYNQALRYINYPYAYQTVGSSFAVTAESYAKQGGMNKRKAGEDFYFLHKIIKGGKFHDLNETVVFPSSRASNRVPFGTGAAIKDMRKENMSAYPTYDFKAFLDLQKFLNKRHELFGSGDTVNPGSKSMAAFLENENFAKDIKHMNKISPNLKRFEKHFFNIFDAFKVVKFLNFSRQHFYPPANIYKQSCRVWKLISGEKFSGTQLELLKLFRAYAVSNPK